MRLHAAGNYGLIMDSSVEQWGKLGPLAAPTPADVRSRGATERKTRGVTCIFKDRGEASARGEAEPFGAG